jgi:hypothetical protein
MTRAQLLWLAERVENADSDRIIYDVLTILHEDGHIIDGLYDRAMALFRAGACLDAAASLAGDAWEIHRQRSPDMGGREWHASVGFTRQTRGKAATPARALTAAALRAMAEEAGDE